MAITLDQIVPWGRTLDEYQRMFSLGEAERARSILGCGDGPASFNAEWTARGGQVFSVDPIYAFSAADIENRVRETYELIINGVRENPNDFVWNDIASPEALGELRLTAMRRFLDDYETGKQQGRYIDASLPALPFADKQFDLALVSHLLFLYSEQLSFDFHRAALEELCRVAREVRIFPLLALGSIPSPHLEPLMEEWHARHYEVELVRVNYEFQKGGHTMLRISSE
jgi:SAM-dependent methyltransferase